MSPARLVLPFAILVALTACNVDVGVTKTQVGCNSDADGDGSCDDEDCAPNDPTIFPGNTETCNGVDDNCDGQIDEGVTTASWPDADGDGYGNPNAEYDGCVVPDGYVDNPGDCDDGQPAIHPSATEVCNGIDDDCDGMTDEDLNQTYYADNDGDGYGDPLSPITACLASPGVVLDSTDCDDTNAAINPAAVDICDGLDNNCDGAVDNGTDTCPDGKNCLDILESGKSTGDGTYLIDPDGSGGAEPFDVLCDMTSDGGGFTQAIQDYLDALDPTEPRTYLYTHATQWYESPSTTDVWDWTTYVGLDGTYLYGDGATTTGSFPCTSIELGTWGVGCSNGSGGMYKVLPDYLDDPAHAMTEVCQDQPDNFGGPVCQDGVAIWVR